MPKNKDLKRLTRSRMQKTGESYTTARARLLAKAAPPASDPRTEPDSSEYATLAGMSDEAVTAKTGSNWQKWVDVLDAKEASTWPHREIAEYVEETYRISGWWAQTVTVGYERIKGLREIGQRRGGSYEANKSRTFPVSVATLYRAWHDPDERERWWPGVELEVRKATEPRSMRITWDDGTPIALWFTAKGDSKSQVQIQQSKLGSKAEAERRKAFWDQRLAALGDHLAGTASPDA